MALSLLVVDDHRLLRQSLRRLLESRIEGATVKEARDGREALGIVRSESIDVVLMDVVMPRLNGVETTARLVGADTETRVIGLSGHSDPVHVQRMVQAGARGFLLKHVAVGQLIEAIRQVAEGGTYFCSSASLALLEPDFVAGVGAGQDLTLREREVLQLLAEGYPTRSIATELGISPKTVEAHRKHVMDKLELRSVAELTKYAVREGLTSLED